MSNPMKEFAISKDSETLFAPITTKRAFEEVSSEIKKTIIRGDFKPGDRLPSEAVLARQFDVSRQTVREALRILELSGFITIQRGSIGGSIIVDTILKSVSESLFDAIQMKKITPDDLTICRLEIEKAMMRYVISYAEDSDIQQLENNILEAKKAAEDGIHPFKINLEFHRILARASRNHMFFIMVDSMMAVIADFYSRIPPDFEISKEVIPLHEEIVEAVRGRNLERALIILEKHIPHIGSRFRAITDAI